MYIILFLIKSTIKKLHKVKSQKWNAPILEIHVMNKIYISSRKKPCYVFTSFHHNACSEWDNNVLLIVQRFYLCLRSWQTNWIPQTTSASAYWQCYGRNLWLSYLTLLQRPAIHCQCLVTHKQAYQFKTVFKNSFLKIMVFKFL